MIKYPSGAFGFRILFRIRGSAVFKAFMPGLVSSIIYVVLFHTTELNEDDGQIMDHPYPMGALIAAFTFLLSFRANFSYNRYWEAFTAVHAMHSKWLDVGIDLAAFHLQAARYDGSKPPSFGANPHLSSLEIERKRHEPTMQEIEHQVDERIEMREKELEDARTSRASGSTSRFSRWWRLRRRRRRNNSMSNSSKPQQQQQSTTPHHHHQVANNARASLEFRIEHTKKNINAPPTHKTSKKKKKKQPKKGHRRIVSTVSVANEGAARVNIDEKPLFLQEGAHLLSLLSAVAMSTLRNDLENAESPLIPFTPGAPFPCVDPDGVTADVRTDWVSPDEEFWFPTLRYLFGLSRNEKSRSVYNAARPFRVIGGVSDNEILLLQAARGPQAKVNLVSLWVQEFIAREHLAGSTGKVAPPIMSRLFQYVSDGCLNYNQARKIAYIPFPFPHAQIVGFFVMVIVAFVPILMLSFVTGELLGFFLNLLTVMCFAGLHEVSRELENPFQNAPNDLPANNLHAQYNEALMAMFAGYHPDAFWEVKEDTGVDDESDPQLPVESINLGEIVAGLQDGEAPPPIQPMNMEEFVAGMQDGNADEGDRSYHRGPSGLDDSFIVLPS
ncbi:Bestrophin, RFP-TM, chloride channel [Seminavis robusta]|uniref:Bestrophin, RFP-TM, chloride channel n=1 Tax=Seminavis robusta TaxID=568900 RepID=A0A9N8DQH1_9STRA|nr:Bestrophin, RFP-TM, chloride channel [Seminavis robusta]|eukprot:Sro274_g105490.1 Bestrophin, RFP-TM, chloride channel (612) ;mRNA; f:50661-53263